MALTEAAKRAVFPACAGVILRVRCGDRYRRRFPRVCGGDPGITALYENDLMFSVHVSNAIIGDTARIYSTYSIYRIMIM